jgi:hypothetical protein
VADVQVKPVDWQAIVGAVLKGETEDLNALLDRVDDENSLTRYYLYVKWMDAATPRPGAQDAPTDWPPWRSEWFVQYERFTKEFVEDFVATQTTRPLNILVTNDPYGEVGYYELDEFSFGG